MRTLGLGCGHGLPVGSDLSAWHLDFHDAEKHQQTSVITVNKLLLRLLRCTPGLASSCVGSGRSMECGWSRAKPAGQTRPAVAVVWLFATICCVSSFRSIPRRSSYSSSKAASSTSVLRIHPSSLVSAQDNWSIWSAISLSAALGLRLEEKTALGRSLSGPVCAMLISTVLTNTGVLPTHSPFVPQLQNFVVSLATPLLLLSADMRKIVARTGDLLKAFALAMCGTLLGSLVGYALFAPWFIQQGLLQDSCKIAGALVAKNIGGGLNFMSVASILSTPANVIGMGLAVDNLAGLLYFPFISWIGTRYNASMKSKLGRLEVDDKVKSEEVGAGERLTVDRMLPALTIGLLITAFSERVAHFIPLPTIIISTLCSVLTATCFSSQLTTLIPAGEVMGKLLLLLFFGSVGMSSGKIITLISSPAMIPLLGFNLVLYIVHLSVVLGLGSLLRLSLPDLLLGSNANIGNAATASALASAMGWHSRLVPAMLVGTLGNVVGTVAGLTMVSHVFQPLLARITL
eukprot:scaffold4731_cov175-Ochromonas_danica.AAC.6